MPFLSKSEQQQIVRSLNSYGRPMVTLKEIAAALGIGYVGLHGRLTNYPKELPRPPTMPVGGNDMMVVDAAEKWCLAHAERWAAIQQERRK